MKILSTIFIPFLTLFLLGGCGPSDSAGTEQPDTDKSIEEEQTALDHLNRENNLFVEIEIEDHGIITVELFPDQAPISVENFINLVNDGFYEGLTFHRIINGFMMQGGAGESIEPIKGEFADNGVDNPLLHTRGAISMARTDVMDSATSQFFIVHEESPHLDGAYAVFGYVTDGMEIVDEICGNTPVQDTNGTVASDDQPIITSIRVIE